MLITSTITFTTKVSMSISENNIKVALLKGLAQSSTASEFDCVDQQSSEEPYFGRFLDKPLVDKEKLAFDWLQRNNNSNTGYDDYCGITSHGELLGLDLDNISVREEND